MITKILNSISFRLFPQWSSQKYNTQNLKQSAQSLSDRLSLASSIEDAIAIASDDEKFFPYQIKSEFSLLLEKVRQVKPQVICEIGGANGGSLALFATVAEDSAKLLSLDIGYSASELEAYKYLGRNNQQIICLNENSLLPETELAVKRILAGKQIDVLFIDGDHSLGGVMSDYVTYSKYVKPGGLIGFHDIVIDHGKKYGIQTTAYTGDVPEFWSFIKQFHSTTYEFIENNDQNGLGIGVIVVDE